MTLGNVKHNTRQIKKLIETHDKLYAELSDTELLTSVNIDLEDQDGVVTTHNVEAYPAMRKWSADLYDREETIKDESTLNNDQNRRLSTQRNLTIQAHHSGKREYQECRR